MIDEKHYTRQEVAKILSVDPMTVYREIQRGKLKAFKVRRDLRISESALQEYIESNKVEPKDE